MSCPRARLHAREHDGHRAELRFEARLAPPRARLVRVRLRLRLRVRLRLRLRVRPTAEAAVELVLAAVEEVDDVVRVPG